MCQYFPVFCLVSLSVDCLIFVSPDCLTGFATGLGLRPGFEVAGDAEELLRISAAPRSLSVSGFFGAP